MTSIPGVRFDITGASGSQGLLGPKGSWKAYVFPRGGYAKQDSAGTLITFDSSDVADRFAVDNWIQAGLLTANIRKVSAVGGNSVAVAGAALTVSENDRIFVIGDTQPTVTGGSATYTTPATTIRERDDDGADAYTNSMVTSNSDGLIQFYSEPALYDCIIQDGNQSNQGFIANLPVGAVEGVSTAYTATFGATVTINAALGVTGTATFDGEATFGSTVTINANLIGDGFAFDGFVSALYTVTSGSGTAASPWVGWQNAFGASTSVFFPTGVYKVDAAATLYDGTAVLCSDGAIFQRDSGNLGVNVFDTGGVAISDFSVSGAIFDNNDLAVTDYDIEITEGSTDFAVERCSWKNMANRVAALSVVGAIGTTYTLRWRWNNNHVEASTNATDTYNSFAFYSVGDFDIHDNIINGWGAIKVENNSAGTTRNWSTRGNRFQDIDQTCIFQRVSGGHKVFGLEYSFNSVTQSTIQPGAVKGLGGLSAPSGGSGGEFHGIRMIGNYSKGRTGHALDIGESTGGTAIVVRDLVLADNIIDGRLEDNSTVASVGRGIDISTANDAKISNNIIRYVGRSGILVGGGSDTPDQIDIEGNLIDTCGQSATTSPTPSEEAGVSIWHNADDVRIRKNTIRNHATATLSGSYTTMGIFLRSSSGETGQNRIVIDDNVIVDDRGAAAAGMDHAIVLGTAGVSDANRPEACICTNNKISGMTSTAILDRTIGAATIPAVVKGNIVDNSLQGDVIETAAALTLPTTGDYYLVAGVTTITSLAVSWPGRCVTLGFSDSVTFTDSAAGGLVLAGNFSAGADDTIELRCNGTSWYETSRSAN